MPITFLISHLTLSSTISSTHQERIGKLRENKQRGNLELELGKRKVLAPSNARQVEQLYRPLQKYWDSKAYSFVFAMH